MDNIIIVTADMHKIATTSVDVKYRHPGNVVAYLPVQFDIYRSATRMFAVPCISEENRRLMDLPHQFSFRIKDEIVLVSRPGLKEIVILLVKSLRLLGLVENGQRDYINNNVIYDIEQLEFV